MNRNRLKDIPLPIHSIFSCASDSQQWGSDTGRICAIAVQFHQFTAGCPRTASFGVTIFQGSVGKLLQRVDTALYEDKTSGRNAVKKA
ncbi:hypothetical protein JWG39_06950 [Desulforhopalus vacuolatus]|uniref:hypothetical protein n=1 Tax=Desulforhopalus vacuolatus TaxID=40414 RepID=UPI0019632726|nr:hypothetical protein [Desulforhopalus vacuolatus]MBM9519556.1 hypothetical protein [Desulforhopalus vacuolatus]